MRTFGIVVGSLIVLSATIGGARIAASAPPGAPAAAAAVQDPRDIVREIYKLAVAGAKKARPDSPFFDRKVRAIYFSKGLDLAVTESEAKAAKSGDAGLDFDPITSSQDAKLGKVTVKTVTLDPTRAVVSASFLNQKQPTVVTYDLIRDDDAWKIDDIRGSVDKQPWSVRKLLADLAR